MIHLTRINHAPLVLNSDLIEFMETTPDTVITLITGQKIVVREDPEEVIRRIVDFRKRICGGTAGNRLLPGVSETADEQDDGPGD